MPEAWRPTWVEINLKALAQNFNQVKKLLAPQVKVCAVVKADAYGHGAIAVSQALAAAGADALAVASVEEGMALRVAGIRKPILLLGLFQPGEAEAIAEYGIEPTVIEPRQVAALRRLRLKQPLGIQVKVDTGMGRLGLWPEEARAWIRKLRAEPKLRIQGVFTHFAHADGGDKTLLRAQIHALQHFRKQGLDEGWLPLGKLLFHAANSAAMMESSQAHFDMVRPGLMLYGCYPAQRFRRKSALQPVLAWKTQIIQLKKVPARQGLSYGHTFVAPRAMHIGIIPVGYADGYSRLYSNRAKVLVAGRLCPVVGRVCMDLALIDLSKIKSPRLGQEVVLLGKQGSRELDADTLANWRTTIAYEVLCNIGRRVHRKYIR